MKQQSKKAKIERKGKEDRPSRLNQTSSSTAKRSSVKVQHSHEAKAAPHLKMEGSEEKVKRSKSQQLQMLPTVQNMLEIPEADRLKKVQEYFEKVKPFLNIYMQKKTGSRVLQLMFKWGSNGIKTAVYQCAIKNWKELIKSKYALYTIAKICREYELPGVPEDYILLQSSHQGAVILEQYMLRNTESHHLKQKLIEMSKKGLEGDLKAQQLLHNLSLKSIEKHYHTFVISKLILRLSIASMFAEEKEKIIEYLVANVADIVADEEGVRLFIQLMNNCGAKHKKSLVKHYKGFVREIVDNNNVAYVSLLKLLTEVDDTVLLANSLLPEIIQLLPNLNTCKKTFSLYFALFSPRQHNYNILGKYERVPTQTQCKKTEEQRKKELRERLYEPLVAHLRTDWEAILRHHINHTLVVGLCKAMSEDGYAGYKEFVLEVVKYYLETTKTALKGKEFEKCVAADSSGNKVIKNILLLKEDFIQFYCDQFASLIRKNIGIFLNSKASFILLALIEKEGRGYLLQEVVNSGLELEKVVAGQHYVAAIEANS